MNPRNSILRLFASKYKKKLRVKCVFRPGKLANVPISHKLHGRKLNFAKITGIKTKIRTNYRDENLINSTNYRGENLSNLYDITTLKIKT
jgi:hypothetical protein